MEKQTGKQFNVLDKSDERDPAKLTLSSPYAINCLEFQGVILIGVDEGRVADAFNALIRCAKVGITTKNDVVKQTGTIAGANVLLLHEQLDELTVDPAARIVYQLLDFQFVF